MKEGLEVSPGTTEAAQAGRGCEAAHGGAGSLAQWQQAGGGEKKGTGQRAKMINATKFFDQLTYVDDAHRPADEHYNPLDSRTTIRSINCSV